MKEKEMIQAHLLEKIVKIKKKNLRKKLKVINGRISGWSSFSTSKNYQKEKQKKAEKAWKRQNLKKSQKKVKKKKKKSRKNRTMGKEESDSMLKERWYIQQIVFPKIMNLSLLNHSKNLLYISQ